MIPLRAWTSSCTAKDRRPYHHLGAVRLPAGSLPTSSASTRSPSTEPSTDRFIHPCARAPPVPSPTQPYAATNGRSPPLSRARSPIEAWANLTSRRRLQPHITCIHISTSETLMGAALRYNQTLPDSFLQFILCTLHVILPPCHHSGVVSWGLIIRQGIIFLAPPNF